MEREALKCPCCGAPAPKDKCDYCGAVFVKQRKEVPQITLEPMTNEAFDRVLKSMSSDWIPEVMGVEKEVETRCSDFPVLSNIVERVGELTRHAMIEQQAYDRAMLARAGTKSVIFNGRKYVMGEMSDGKGKGTDAYKSIITRIFSRRGDSNE